MTEKTYETEDGEIRLYHCDYCNHEWLEWCDADEYPEYCPLCGDLLASQH